MECQAILLPPPLPSQLRLHQWKHEHEGWNESTAPKHVQAARSYLNHQQTKPIFPRAKSSRQVPLKIKKKELNCRWTWTSRGRWRRRRKSWKEATERRPAPTKRSSSSLRSEERKEASERSEREICRQNLAFSPPESS